MSHFVISLNVNEQDLSYFLQRNSIQDPKGLLQKNNFSQEHLEVEVTLLQTSKPIDLVAVYIRDYEIDSHNNDILCEQNDFLASESILNLSKNDLKKISQCYEIHVE